MYIEELSKVMDEIRKKAYKTKDALIKDATRFYTTLHNTMNSEIAKAKKEGKKIEDVKKEFEDLLRRVDLLRERQKNMSVKDLRHALVTYTHKAEELVKKIKG